MAWANPPLFLFHGTDLSSARSIIRAGVDRTKFRPGTDFGPGFYTTTSLVQAQEWANRRAIMRGLQTAVIEFTIDRDLAADLQSVWFVRAGAEGSDFWNLVQACRSGTSDHGRMGAKKIYDLAVGPVAINWINPPLKTRGDSDQVSFHTDNALAILRTPRIVR